MTALFYKALAYSLYSRVEIWVHHCCPYTWHCRRDGGRGPRPNSRVGAPVGLKSDNSSEDHRCAGVDTSLLVGIWVVTTGGCPGLHLNE